MDKEKFSKIIDKIIQVNGKEHKFICNFSYNELPEYLNLNKENILAKCKFPINDKLTIYFIKLLYICKQTLNVAYFVTDKIIVDYYIDDNEQFMDRIFKQKDVYIEHLLEDFLKN